MPEPVAARALPQFTRSLRGLLAPHAIGTPAHDGLVLPFLDARRRAHLATRLEGQLQAFDAAALRTRLLGACAAIAAERWPASAPDARALTALLEDAARPLLAALVAADRSARWLEGAGDADRDRCWSAWVDALREVFRALDRFWLSVQPTIHPLPARRRAPIPPHRPRSVPS